jgi:predicted transcriptional regulator
MKPKTIRVGILSAEAYKQRTLAIARGEYVPKKDEPKIWFESLKSMAQVLGSDNQALLKIIMEKKPTSLSELETLTGRRKSNLSRTLKMLERYGIVTLHKKNNRIVPEVMASHFRVEFGLGEAA